MKRSGSKTLKIAAATSMSIFGLLAVFVATYAWFSTNLSTNNSGMQLTVSTMQENFKQMTLHKFIETDDGTIKFYKDYSGKFEYDFDTNTTTFSGTSSDAFMGQFSLMDPRHPFLALIEYDTVFTADSSANKVYIHGDTDHYFIGAMDDQGNFYEELSASGNPLSSVVRFAGSSYTSLTTGTAVVEDETVQTYNFSEPVSWQHFVNIGVTPDALTFDNETGWDPEKTFFEATSGQIKYIAIIFDYYDEALEYIYNIYLGNEFLERDSIPFTCDWKMVV